MKNIVLALAIGLVMSTIIAINSQSIQNDLANNLIRLHIVANSDSENDQAVKLKVRDRIIKEMGAAFEDTKSNDECRKIVRDNIDKIVEIANDELSKNGMEYGARAYFGRFDFPTKYYSNIVLPRGEYNAVRVELGGGDGQNWWCVMYPPLCFVEESKGKIGDKGDKVLKNSLNSESYDIITNGGDKLDFEVRFKLVELFSGR